MSRFEDQLKDRFEHFEPEVNAGLWEQISRQMPASPGSGQAPLSGLGKGMLVKMGLKGWIIAASITVAALTTVLYLRKEEPKAPSSEKPTVTLQTPATAAPEVSSAGYEAVDDQQTTVHQSVPASASQNKNEAVGNQPAVPHTSTHALTALAPGADLPPATSATAPAPASQSKNATGTKAELAEIQAVDKVLNSSGTKQAASPEPTLILSTQGGFAPLPVTVMTNLENTAADFDFGDGEQVLQVPGASHTYTETGTYTLSCTVNGKVLTRSIQVIGQMPSAFSPNGDGINDEISLGGDVKVMRLELRIFNRSGKLIYSAKGNNVRWDGRDLNGQQAEAGTYIYDIFASSESGELFKQKGALHLFR